MPELTSQIRETAKMFIEWDTLDLKARVWAILIRKVPTEWRN